MKKMIKNWIEKKLEGYRIQLNETNSALPQRAGSLKQVAVIGAGLAGIACSSVLAERGFRVTLFEKNSYLGGKLGAWPRTFSDGMHAWIDHGFHAFFYQYYNLNNFLKKIGVSAHFSPIGEYLIHGENIHFGFTGGESVPLLNMLDMRKKGLFRFRDVLRSPKWIRMVEFLKYSEERCFSRFDHISFQEFADSLDLPPAMRTVFVSFTRAFFADPDRISLAELMKSFHFFYLSHDFGILYDYLAGDCHRHFCEPARKWLAGLEVEVRFNEPVNGIEKTENGFMANGIPCDFVILAADAPAAKEIAGHSPFLKEMDPAWYDQLLSLKPAQGYAVYKFWSDRRIAGRFPAFFITDRFHVLDAVAQFHLIDDEARKWAESCGGGVYEAHCYAVPEKYFGDEEAMKRLFLDEMSALFPELKGGRIPYENFHMNDNFTAFHKGLHAGRPRTAGGIENFYVAGDWVRIPSPAMLMEGALTSGLMAANEVLKQEGLAEEPVFSVPLKGLLAR